MSRQCPTGKVRHSNIDRAKIAARSHARALNADRKLAQDMHAYRCRRCKGWHLTRQGERDGSILVLTAAPEHLQRWAMGLD